ncbi:MAG: helix-turn-helix domain-containing protein [Kiritimatiellia bacterium]
MRFSSQDLAEQIRSARKQRGLSLKQLAELAGIGKTAMFDLEHGNPGVRLSTLTAVLEKLDLDLALIKPGTELSSLSLSSPEPEPAAPPEILPDHLL